MILRKEKRIVVIPDDKVLAMRVEPTLEYLDNADTPGMSVRIYLGGGVEIEAFLKKDRVPQDNLTRLVTTVDEITDVDLLRCYGGE